MNDKQIAQLIERLNDPENYVDATDDAIKALKQLSEDREKLTQIYYITSEELREAINGFHKLRLSSGVANEQHYRAAARTLTARDAAVTIIQEGKGIAIKLPED